MTQGGGFKPRARPDIPDGLAHLLPRFLAEIAKDTAALHELAASGDSGGLAERAHAAHGKCAMFGEAELAGVLAQLEARASCAEFAEIRDLLKRMVARNEILGVYDDPNSRMALP